MSRNLDDIFRGFPSMESDMPTAGGVSDSLEVGQVVDEDGHQVDTSDTVEEELITGSEDVAEIDEASDEVDLFTETADSLESFLDQAVLGRRNGGWSRQEAHAYSVGLDTVFKRLGNADSSAVMPATESFDTTRERINATTAVENRIKETLVKLWEAIKRAVNKVIVFVRKWYLKIFDGATKLKKRAQALRKKADNTSGTIKEKKIRTGVLTSLNVDKNMPKGADIAKGIDELKVIIESVTAGPLEAGFKDKLDDLVSAVEKMGDAEVQADRLGSAIDALDGTIGSIINLSSGWDSPAAPNADLFPQLMNTGAKIYNAKLTHLFGNRKIYTIGYVKGDNTATEESAKIDNLAKVAGNMFTIRIENKDKKKVEVDESKEVETLNSSDVSSICSSVEALCDVVIDYRKGFENYESASKKIIAKMDKLASKKWDDVKNEKGDSGIAAKTVRKFANAIGAMMRNRGNGISNIINHGLTISRNALSYGSQSLSQYKDD